MKVKISSNWGESLAALPDDIELPSISKHPQAPKELQGVFPVTELITDTAKVLNRPSQVSREMVLQAVAVIDWTQALKDIGFVTARELADDLEAMALRPADYAALEDLPQLLAASLSKALKSVPTEFVSSLVEGLRLRG